VEKVPNRYCLTAEDAEIAQRVQKKTFQRNNLSSSFVTPHEVDFPDSFEVLI
jgi:hypothetical protein